jgi:class 3 adenylate cyclase/tetratricopeptide (TPR) repeat protein
MNQTLDEQIKQLRQTISSMEAQRPALGHEVVDAALAPLQRKLDELMAILLAQQARTPTQPTQQRKLVTLLFMDIAGSTAIAQDMDPEDVCEVFDVALNRLAIPIEAHGGHVTRFMGDGFLAVFGAPLAREDDPEQCIRAGLGIIAAAQELAPELQEEWEFPEFQIRVGVNTGLVAIGGLTEAEDTLMGAAVNLAARLESAAPAGGLLISHDTYRHVRGLFDVEPQDPVQAKGFDEPVQVYRVLRAKPRTFRTYTRGVEGVETRMIGREAELKTLQDALLTAIEDGEGQVITISGEAGVGKSRLLYEFQNWIELSPARVRFFEGRGRYDAQGLPYGLLRDLFEFRFQIQDDDQADIARQKLVGGLMEVFSSVQDGEMRAHILGQMLGFEFSASPHLKGVLSDPEQLRNRGRAYLAEFLEELSSQGQVMIFLEDIHWADDSSLDALNWLGERLYQQRLLVVCATRPTLFERRPYWGEGLAYHQRLELEPLSKRESRQLVAEIFKLADRLPDELRDLVVEGAEGNPFYLEELVKMLVEDGVIARGEEVWRVHPERLAEIEVPPTLAGVLQARLDSLPVEERTVLQQASVVGRQFWDRVLAHVQFSGGGSPQLVPEALTSLRGRELIYRREGSAFAEAREYIFKHDILREVTYESVLKRLRKVYHGLVADWLITQEPERSNEYSGLIAEHLLQAGSREQACQYFLQAGQAALETYANTEAETHFRKVLDLSPGESQRAACLAGLGEALGRQGHIEEVDQTLRQAIVLYHAMGEYDRVATLYTRLSQILWHDDHLKAWETCQEGLAQLEDDPEVPGLALLVAEAGRNALFRALPKNEVISLCNQAIELAVRLRVVEAQAEASITLALISEDPQQSISILKEIAALSEAHGLLGTASRAHFDIGYFYSVSLGGANPTYQHYLKSAEIARQIGDIDQTIFGLISSGRYWISLGNLKSWEEMALEFLSKSSATESQIQECLQLPHGWVLYFRGEWMQAVEYFRVLLQETRKGGSLQEIAEENLGLVNTILELHRFAGLDYIAEAEAALLENIDIHWHVIESYLLLSIISARKGMIQEAYEHLEKAVQATGQALTNEDESYRMQAEAEYSRAEGRWDDALTLYRSYIDIYQRGEYCWEWARHLIDLGDVLQGRNGPGDREEAEEVYRQSLEMFTEMGAHGYSEVLEVRLKELKL